MRPTWDFVCVHCSASWEVHSWLRNSLEYAKRCVLVLHYNNPASVTFFV
jgi:hypothetical protein